MKKIILLLFCLCLICPFVADATGSGGGLSVVNGIDETKSFTATKQTCSSIVGIWYNERKASGGQNYAVAVFDSDGTFFFVSNGPNGMENFKGNYQVTANGLQVTNWYWFKCYTTKVFSEFKDLLRIIREGSRDEVFSLTNADHPYYASNNGWERNSDKDASLEFLNDDKIRTNLFATGTIDYERR